MGQKLSLSFCLNTNERRKFDASGETYAWTTSNALHAVNIADAKQRYLLPANSLAVATDEEYKGNLILNQHRYFIGGGSYDWYWLFTPEGKEIGPLGEEPSIK